ncbi:multicopper oxidase family protein [Paenibacillus allorhizosphaerae]|uniref:Multicopper oxidase MmcO n=1 Tax=Paenibacillus allorhizosphaerae TaxID=2849866 RepID=A0ABN7TZB4_9BACL|nr:multicopper oxidase family protein [Paenibacillus allorhizosphaerae]CAG7658119.1 Multicopper oxidase MmcO [Paenibacillus allorhizosphaerae]
MRKRSKMFLNILFVLIALGGGSVYTLAKSSVHPASMNMGSMSHGMGGMGHLSHMDGISVATLKEAASDAPVKTFELTAEEKELDIGDGKKLRAWTFNGIAPGPEIRVQEGDRLIVHVKNQLTAGVTIHWHGVELPNAEDGVAGVTQDAIPTGGEYTYNFIARHPGTYWYHSHQQSEIQTGKGLFGALIVEPKQQSIVYDREIVSILHQWDDNTFTIDGTSTGQHYEAEPGELVRLRLINSGDSTYRMALAGTPYKIVAMDAYEINKPTDLDGLPFVIGSGQRYDLEFKMPESGAVQLLNVDKPVKSSNLVKRWFFTPSSEAKNQALKATIGKGALPAADMHQLAQMALFNTDTYGSPLPDGPNVISLNSKFTAAHSLTLGNKPGFFNGRFTMRFTINGKTFPDTPMVMVKTGDLVKMHLKNESEVDDHPMHLHGHSFQVIAHNGQPLTGSPITLSTITVPPKESYDIAFLANNPGIWMIHCHILGHAANGMDMMVNYEGITTPYSVGKTSGNFPD